MKKKFFGLVILLIQMLAVVPVQAVTVYYQPTPYPLKKMNGTSLPQDLEKIHIHDGWLNNYYTSLKNFQRDEKMKMGGWTDLYRSYLNMDLTGLPENPTSVVLWLRFYPSGSSTTPFQFCIPNSSWGVGMTWDTQPTFLGCTQNLVVPTTDSWKGWYITPWYQNWKNGTWGKYGMMLNPQYTSNNFNFIRSSRYADYANDPSADGKRPILQLDFTQPAGMPNFKMPLPGGASWLLTNEIGGYECKGESPWPDTAHQGNNYFSLDFSPTNFKDDGGSYPLNAVPILAVAEGTVSAVETNPNNVNANGGQGWYITLNHGNGYLTRYLHLASRSSRANGIPLNVGDHLNQGDQLGIMGGTGGNYGVHLHINFWYNTPYNGGSGVTNLTYVTTDGWLLKSFQTECSVNGSGVPTSRIRYYHSSNNLTGN